MERSEVPPSQSNEAEMTPRADVLSQSTWQLSKSTDDLFRHFLTMSGDALRTSSNSLFSLNQSSASPFSAAQSFAVDTTLSSAISSPPLLSGLSSTSLLSPPPPAPPPPPATVHIEPRLASTVLHMIKADQERSDDEKVASAPVVLPPNINPDIDPEPNWDEWNSEQKREWLRLHDVKGTWEKNLNQKCSDVWLKIQQKIPVHASTKPERKIPPVHPVDPTKWSPSLDFPDEPIWPMMIEEKKRAFLKKHDIRGIWAKHLDMKCSELWRKTHQPAHETGHLTRKAAAARALAAAAAAASTPVPPSEQMERPILAVVPRDPVPVVKSVVHVDVPTHESLPASLPAIVTDTDRLANFPRKQLPTLIQLARENNIDQITSMLNTTFSQVMEADRQKRVREESALSLGPDELATLGPLAKRIKLAEEGYERQIEEKNQTIEILAREVARLREENLSLQEKNHTLLNQFGNVTDVLKSIAQNSAPSIPHPSVGGAQ
eukprot:TRINITY_DN1561_c0_g1_i1.p1 TRINITY_DN1561_c0_g1~~TRINITY_DN1561_c0_g1_i1.p1  ORF type:complete len:491 (+),score=75.42 TRINITY_DN1561_c0_g1_i1:283-1755(+)